MRTDDLIALLAAGAGPVGPAQDGRRLALGLPAALAAAALAVWWVLGFVAPDRWAASATVPKLAYAALLAASALWLMRRAGRPGARVALPAMLPLAVLSAAAALGLADHLGAAPQDRLARLMGHSSWFCPFAILTLSFPALAVTLSAARMLAPLRLQLAGAAAGLAAGAVAATAYALACTEGALSFVAVWYTAGMLLAAGLGALIGPRVLRW